MCWPRPSAGYRLLRHGYPIVKLSHRRRPQGAPEALELLRDLDELAAAPAEFPEEGKAHCALGLRRCPSVAVA